MKLFLVSLVTGILGSGLALAQDDPFAGIEEMVVEGGRCRYTLSIVGSNAGVMQKHKRAEARRESEMESPPAPVRVASCTIRGMRILAKTPFSRSPKDIGLPEVVVTDIGGADGLTPAALALQMTDRIGAQAVEKIGRRILFGR